MKFAVFSHVLPPSGSGQGVVLYRLLEHLPQDEYVLISCKSEDNTTKEPQSSKRLLARYYFLKIPPKAEVVIKDYLKKTFVSRVISYLSTIKSQSKELKEILIKEKCDVLVACTGDFFGMPVAYLAARKLKIRFIIYSFDDYVYQWAGVLRTVARFISRFAFRRADDLIVPNEFLQKAYRGRFHRESTIIRNPYLPFPLAKKERLFNKDELNIIYTGAVSSAHFDAFKNLVEAMKLMQKPVKFHLFTGQHKEMLEREGIIGEQVQFHNHVDQSEISAIQKQADILFLPLAFNSPINETVRTSAPSKMGEYMVSGIPILVHAPKDSFLSWYFKKNNCGIVVDVLDPKILADTIFRTIEQKDTVKEITANAKERVKIDFSVNLARKNFMSVINQK